jgi:hypothetical protein
MRAGVNSVTGDVGTTRTGSGYMRSAGDVTVSVWYNDDAAHV